MSFSLSRVHYVLAVFINLVVLQVFAFAVESEKSSSVVATEQFPATSNLLDSSDRHSQTDTTYKKQNSGANLIDKNGVYLQGDIDILSQDAPKIIQELSSVLYKKTGVKVFLHVVERTPQDNTKEHDDTDINERFHNRRFYESRIIEQIHGNYAIIFLFYSDHAITLKSNLDFLSDSNVAELLENYAYPYLPADKVGTPRYDNGVNEGVSNLYLALIHTIAQSYNVELNAPKPMERQSDVTKVIIYSMLLILLGLFVLVRFGLLAFKKKG
ncbi:hypothetical protein NHP164001_05860 [Helicobacter trogontum]|uniref:TPM domain-containing protein n=1 Tax=Helicobacter trogontum TaxID=50960 RepID=A0ABQ0D2J7_9HELI|nr:TPM domain-containing protein [Helicobacter trogontum]